MRAANIDLQDASIAITGGGRGIGLSTARAFAERGAKVYLGDIDVEAAQRAAASIGEPATALPLDVTDRESVDSFVAAILHDADRIDVLVNNAGIMPTGRFLDESDALSHKQVEINLMGPIHGMKAVLPGMIDQGRGHIVNVASMLGKVHAPGLATYVATKHAIVGLSDCVRDELDGTGVTLTTILPTAVKTELVAGLPIGGLFAVPPERVAEAIVASVGHRRAEVAVPRWMAGYSLVKAVTPGAAMRSARRRLGAGRLMDPVDGESRRQYQTRIEN
ncbi:MAG: SDR family oxidoreductase [Actinobacteria bacterium]|nr:SDR family oxidoreductase [Actinomycetota bacterium]